MKNSALVAVFLLCFLSISAYAQKSARLKEIHQDADFFFERQDYREAISQYMLLIDNGYESANIKFKIGVCYLNMPGEETRSIPYLEEASRSISVKYKPKELEETKAPLHTLFFLGNAYRINNELSKALATYDKFITHPGFFGNYNLNIVDTEVKACERAKSIQDNPVQVDWVNLGEPVNTATSETCPVVSGNDSVLVYLSEQKLYNGIFYCRRMPDNKWSEPVNLNPQVISDGDFYPTGLSYDGRELFLVKKAATNSDIYVSVYKNEKWSPAKRLGDNVNSGDMENHASISPDGKTLYFTSNRSNSRGGYDIYTSARLPNGEWGKAQNLGKVVNTPQDEATPFIASDNKTLYFSSKGHFNMGGYDVFYSTLENKKWAEPSNLGYPVNNTNDNLFYCPVLEGTRGYFARINKQEGKGREDIYSVNVKSKLVIKQIASGK